MKLDLVTVPSPSLRKKAEFIKDPESCSEIAKWMLEVMYKHEGIGLAGNQIAFNHRIFVMDLSENRDKPQVFINPMIIKRSEEHHVMKEGCLSIPGVYADVIRSSEVEVLFYNEKGKEEKIIFKGLGSSCVQHEIDHLDGILFPDRLPGFKQTKIWKDYSRSLK